MLLFSKLLYFQDDDPFTILKDNGLGCPAQWDSGSTYEHGDAVESNGVVYTCSGAIAYCNLHEPNLRGIALNYWKPTASCTGTMSPTVAPSFGSTQDGCPGQYDSNAVYEAGDIISVKRGDGRTVMYICKAFPSSQFCNVEAYSPLNTALQCNGGVCWPEAWNYAGGCTGSYSPTAAPTFDPVNIGGCPEQYDPSTNYVEGDKVSIRGAGETYGKIYQCKSWPSAGYCVMEEYKPGPGGEISNGKPLWQTAWTYVGGCTGSNSPTSSPTFDPAGLVGCPEEYHVSTGYVDGDKVSIKGDDDSYGKIYQCKPWPSSGYCAMGEYKPGPGGNVIGGKPLWQSAWTYVGGCAGTNSPTASPTFEIVLGCPEEYDPDTYYEEGDRVSITAADKSHSKIYKCRPWPQTTFCNIERYKPGPDGEVRGGEPVWQEAWTYEGGCEGTIAPTQAPIFRSIREWKMEGCPMAYVPNNPDYRGLDYVSVPTNSDNTLGVVWQCKDAVTWPWCTLEGYAPGTRYGGDAWERVGHCVGTMSPTAAPTPLSQSLDPAKKHCQFKHLLPSREAYVVFEVESWIKGGIEVTHKAVGISFNLYEVDDFTRYGRDVRKCNGYPYSRYCIKYSPFRQDLDDYNYYWSPKAWSVAECVNIRPQGESTLEAIHSDGDPGDADEFLMEGPVFDLNGNVLVYEDGDCVNFAINPKDCFKSSPEIKCCQLCEDGFGFDITDDLMLCTSCPEGSSSKIVDGRTQCVCDNGAANPWDIQNNCSVCVGGTKLLGYSTYGSGEKFCVDECPTDYPYFNSVEKDMPFPRVLASNLSCPIPIGFPITCTPEEIFLCCKEASCTTVEDCHDGTSGKTTCAFALN